MEEVEDVAEVEEAVENTILRLRRVILRQRMER